MANNIFTGTPNFVTANSTVSFATAGLTNLNTTIVYTGNPLKSWKPGRSINGITGFEAGKGYMIYSLSDLDLAAYVSPPAVGVDKIRATSLAYNLDALLSKPEGTLLTMKVEETTGNFVTIGTYTTQAGDTVVTTLAQQIAGAIRAQSATTGYFAYLASDTVKNDSVLVVARGGLGASLNGQEFTIFFPGGGTGSEFEFGVD